ncbi:MAG: IgA Peptidase M64 [Myxococcota bacterium]|nr:IgA Peptidase M64 [Myxococcota bacterium]
MIPPLLFTLVATSLAAAPPAPAAPKTMRVDYFHAGTATEETFSLDRVVLEPLPWPGNPDRALDDSGYGKYRFEVKDAQSGKVHYSRGFASIYGEWETTAEAKTLRRTFHESARFPAPQGKVILSLQKRGERGGFQEVWKAEIDPADMFVDPSSPPSPGKVLKLHQGGAPAKKVDLLILGDGYTARQRAKFEKDARRLTRELFAHSPFKERKGDFNVYGICPPSDQPGISRPSTGLHRRSRIGATYDAFGSERYILTFENRALRDVAAFAPYEFIVILTNTNTYGGGGIFNLYSTVAADSLWSPYLFIHEFGHHFAGLADEYFTSETAYAPATDRPEPWEENVTALLDPAQLKWKDLVEAGTPVPTPWQKAAFEAASAEYLVQRKKIRSENRPEQEMDALFVQQQKKETALFAQEKYRGQVGAFEGAMYESQGYYRPQVDCIMFSRNQVPFCQVCSRAIEKVIDLYAR